MLFSIKDREDLEKIEELDSLQNQVKAARLQDMLDKHDFDQGMKNVIEPVTDTINDTSKKSTQNHDVNF